VLARQWPIDLAVTENGAMAHYVVGGVLATIDPLDPAARAARRAALAALVSLLAAEFGDVPLADDNHARVSDVTFDVGERARVAADRIAALRAAAQALGARCFESSIHLHVTLDAADKASGTLAALARVLGEDVGAARTRYAFVGDSANDAACFAAFHLGFGVANVRAELARLTLPPRFVSASAAGEGFCEVVDRLLALRA
jgi:hydroxymethylpyrimidine pyrophosphatase-like HAD family hydrolase